MKLFNKVLLLVLISTITSCSKSKVFTESDIHIIPKPAELHVQKGFFEFTTNTQIVVTNDFQQKIANQFSEKMNSAAGFNLQIVAQAPNDNFIHFLTNSQLTNEAYELSVTSNSITISASGNVGFMYGLETLKQLLPAAIESSTIVINQHWIVPNVEVKDQPRFKWRGLHLDVARHFFQKDYIKQTIDRLAMHKMNVLHLHLVDDQGWRIEIKKYPKLTEVGAFRLDQEDAHWDGRRVTTAEDKATFGGFYTQEDIKEIVAYATAKGVEVVPEIEMPAHVMSAIASYPELSCFENPIGVPSGGVWPITEIYCAGKESTFNFLEDVLLEVMELFPSKYIHVGGDEATKTNWAKCPHCLKRMKDNGLTDVNELQSYFMKRIERFIVSHDRKLIGWDEIIEGGLAPEATVMSWRGFKGGIEAAEQGHDVVMAPGDYCYLNHFQGPPNEEPLAQDGFVPLHKVYQFDPIVEGMTEKEAAHVLGGQACLWSEFISTTAHSEYMLFPRLAALSETLWSPKKAQDWNDFSVRLTSLFERYDYLGINYSKSAFLITEDVKINIDTKEAEIHLKNEFENSDIRYVLGDAPISESAIKYENPIKFKETTTLKASLFKDDKPIGKTFEKTITFHKGVGKSITFKEPYHDNYQGEGEFGLINTLRGTKNFHDGHWQAWLGNDMEAIIDMGSETAIQNVIIGTMENQGPGIYFPTAVKVYVSNDGINYKEVGKEERAYAKNPAFDLKDFKITFQKESVRYIKIVATNLKTTPSGGDVWLFIDEILIN
jgi:hexosaminidase